MDEGITRKERRRKRAEKTTDDEIQKIIKNSEPRTTQSAENLFRRDTYKVLKSKSDLHTSPTKQSSVESCNCFTFNVDRTSDESEQKTYNVEEQRNRPIPAPRKRKSLLVEQEKVSSDTDKDITEIDVDDLKAEPEPEPEPEPRYSRASGTSPRQSKDFSSSEPSLVAPTPKPRKMRATFQVKDESSSEIKRQEAKSKSLECLVAKNESLGQRNVKSDPEMGSKDSAQHSTIDFNELPLIADLHNENSSVRKKEKKKTRAIVAEFLDRRKKKEKSRKMFPSVMKLDAEKVQRITSILKEKKAKEVETKMDLPMDSPQYPKSADNGNIYVQSKNGFRLMGREEVLKNGNFSSEDTRNAGMAEGSTVKTAILYQRYWSKLMTFFHGVLAGFALGHALIVMGIMLLHNYDPTKFIAFYSCLSLKIHFMFYILITFCIISCFDRIDVGHMNRKHWQIAWKIPSMWLIVSFYLVSFGLTFSNQKTETRFDAYFSGNETEENIWNTRSPSDIQVNLISWYHISWARDVLVILAWMVISLTNFSDFLTSHLSNMRKYIDTKVEDGHQISSGEPQYL